MFLLSPAQCGGPRAAMLLRADSDLMLARRLKGRGGAPIAEVFDFLSPLYFRGKLAYARAFARPPPGAPATGVLVITPSAGLRPADAPLTASELRAFARVDVHEAEPRYRRPLMASARALRSLVGDAEVVLLGSLATPKYIEPLALVFGERLLYPVDFAGRGDLSRGSVCLAAARGGVELRYAPVVSLEDRPLGR